MRIPREGRCVIDLPLLRHLPLHETLERIESAAVESADGQHRDDIAFLGRRLASAARGLESIAQ
jgi:hypothetical protein